MQRKGVIILNKLEKPNKHMQSARRKLHLHRPLMLALGINHGCKL
jgi:hypothetical protein